MKYRKLPIVVEAFQMTRERRADNSEWPEWLNRAWNETVGELYSVYASDYPDSDGTDELEIFTLEGPQRVSFGDWIIQGIAGELYPCKPHIFEQIYEPVP